MPVEQIETIMRAPAAVLDTLARAIWQDHAAGRLADAEAQQLAETIEARRQALRRPTQGPSMLKVLVAREEPERPPAASPGSARTARSGPRQLTLQIGRAHV